ncbi:MAG: class I SAM-dependent methyltransferase [Candidatus Poribacteria bacterium]
MTNAEKQKSSQEMYSDMFTSFTESPLLSPQLGETTYGSRFAQYSQIIYEKIRNTEEEVAFLDWAFQNLSKINVQRVLDVACGTGRHAIPLTKIGYNVIGLDLSDSMLACFKQQAKNAELTLPAMKGDMRYLPFVESFDAIYCMFSSLNHLLKGEELLLSLRTFYNALRIGGIAILDLINPLKFFRLGFQPEEIQTHQRDGVTVTRTLKHSIDEINAIWHQDEFVTIDDGENSVSHHELHSVRILTYPEVNHLLKDAGFSESKCFGDFKQRQEAKGEAARLIVVATKNCSVRSKAIYRRKSAP